jgi:hypothetical protein
MICINIRSFHLPTAAPFVLQKRILKRDLLFYGSAIANNFYASTLLG